MKNKSDFYKIVWNNTLNEKMNELKHKLKLTDEDEQKLIITNPSLGFMLGIKDKRK